MLAPWSKIEAEQLADLALRAATQLFRAIDGQLNSDVDPASRLIDAVLRFAQDGEAARDVIVMDVLGEDDGGRNHEELVAALKQKAEGWSQALVTEERDGMLALRDFCVGLHDRLLLELEKWHQAAA